MDNYSELPYRIKRAEVSTEVVDSWDRLLDPGVAYDHLRVTTGRGLRPEAREAGGYIETTPMAAGTSR